MKSERDVKKEIKAYLSQIGAYYFLPVQTGYGRRTLDILCCVQGRFVGIECKRPKGGEVSSFQRVVIDEINHAGGLAFVARDVETVKYYIEEYIFK